MPIYEYHCEKCNHEFEVWQKITDNPPRSCPECRGRKISRLISQTSFQLKGTGWYATDYANKNTPPAKAEKAETKTESKRETKKESKPETKKDKPSK